MDKENSIDKQTAAWTWKRSIYWACSRNITCSMDINMQYGYKHTAWKGDAIDIGMQHAHGNEA
jgi:hypothetical protein